MRRALFALLLPLAACGSLFAQQPSAAPSLVIHSFTLEVQSVANGGKSTTTRDPVQNGTARNILGTTTGSVTTATDTRESKTRTNLQLSVHNLAAQPDTVTVEWYFMAAPAQPQPGAKEFLFDHGTQDVSVRGGATETFVASSQEATAVNHRQSSLVRGNDGSVGVSMPGGVSAPGYNFTTGTAIRGWFVRLVAGGKVLAVRGSSQKYEEIAKNQAQINALPSPPATRGPFDR